MGFVYNSVSLCLKEKIMKLAAITGSIGCGKTTLAKEVKSLGYPVYDVDGWVRRLYNKKAFIKVIGENFPSVMESGRVNKRKLRQIVFDNNEELKKLEGLIHPFLKMPELTLCYFWMWLCFLKWGGIGIAIILSLPTLIMKFRNGG